MTAVADRVRRREARGHNPVSVRRAMKLVQRNVMVYRHTWNMLLSGFADPLMYMLVIGFAMGKLVGDVRGPLGEAVPYAAFVAPGMLAGACMQGAVFECFFNVYFRLNHERVYDGVLATPINAREIALGEAFWAILRSILYAGGFLILMTIFGLNLSFWAWLALPASILLSAAFVGMALVFSTYASKPQHFDIVMGLVIMPMFLLSTTFVPLEAYPGASRPFLQLTPLYHGVNLIRALTLGQIHPGLLVHAAYLIVFGVVGTYVALRRFERKMVV